MHYIIEVFKSLKNRGILLKRTTKKGVNQRRWFLANILGPLIKIGLRLMKNALTPFLHN